MKALPQSVLSVLLQGLDSFFEKRRFVPSSAERFCAGPVCPNRRTKPQAIASTYFHRRVTHLTALRVLRLGAWSAVMLAHHKGRATTSEGPARPPEGSLFAAPGGRRRRLTMSGHRRRAASYPEAAKNDHMYHPSMKVSTGLWHEVSCADLDRQGRRKTVQRTRVQNAPFEKRIK